jgi:hypothetical protein
VVEPDVEGIRRPDGALTFVDAAPFKTAWQGPLSVLRELLDLEAREIRAWSKTGFARFHRVTAARRVDRICREQGSEAAVDWVLANATAEVNIGELRDRLGARLFNAGGFDEDYYRAEVGAASNTAAGAISTAEPAGLSRAVAEPCRWTATRPGCRRPPGPYLWRRR